MKATSSSQPSEFSAAIARIRKRPIAKLAAVPAVPAAKETRPDLVRAHSCVLFDQM